MFHPTANTGSITAASNVLHISQPALSQKLREPGASAGLTLFERPLRPKRLTQPNEILAEYAARLFYVANAAELAMTELASAPVRHLSIAASNTIGAYVLPRILARLRAKSSG